MQTVKIEPFSFSISTDSFFLKGYTEPIIWKGAQWMVRKLMCTLFAAAMLLNLSTGANAAEEGGSIRVSLNVGELPVTNGSLSLYQVGTPVTDGYRLTEGFGGGIVKEEDAQSPHLAKWLAEGAGETGIDRLLDVDGNAKFSHLEAGLYLIMQTEKTDGFYPLEPFLLMMPSGERWHLQVNADPEPIVIDELSNPQTGQPAAPFLGAMGLVASGVGLYLCADKKRRK